jgi:hypothetical protein
VHATSEYLDFEETLGSLQSQEGRKSLRSLESLSNDFDRLLHALEDRNRKMWHPILKRLVKAETKYSRRKMALEIPTPRSKAGRKATCRIACDMVQADLPRELRDLIYE